MNRTYINLLCILILGVLAASILYPGIKVATEFTRGLGKGVTEEIPANGTESDNLPIQISASNGALPPEMIADSLTFDNGEKLDVSFSHITIYTPHGTYPHGLQLAVGLAMVAVVILYFIFAYKFIRLMVFINRGIIFDKRNISLLNSVGIILLSMALLEVFIGVAEDYVVSSIGLTLGGISFSSAWSIPWSGFLLGMLALLMAQVWYRGLQLKEDQELTI